MKARNLSHRLIAVITFFLGLGATLLWSNLSQPDKFRETASGTTVLLKPARFEHYANDVISIWIANDLMALTRPEQLSISAPLQEEDDVTEDIIETNCGAILLSINADHVVTLNGEQVGTLENFEKVAATLKGFFNERTRMRAFSWSMQSRGDLLDEERIYRTVLIKPSPSLTLAEVASVIEVVKETGAKPIGVYTSQLEP